MRNLVKRCPQESELQRVRPSLEGIAFLRLAVFERSLKVTDIVQVSSKTLLLGKYLNVVENN